LKGTHGNAGKVPAQIAVKLAGKSYRSFDHFREEFWKAAAKDRYLSRQFNASNLERMRSGKAPYASGLQQQGGRQKYEIDHQQPIAKGGNVYDMNNLIIRTPYNHIKGK
jgi:filamentous hemagglutinin